MKKRTKRIACGLSAVLLAICLGGCGTKTDSSGGKADAGAKETVTDTGNSTDGTVDEAVDSKVDYSVFAGEFMDSYSQRAYAIVTENPDWDGVTIEVDWSNSASEYIRWTMTATLEGEDRLVYSDCVTERITTDANGTSSVETLARNGTGYFEWNCQTGALSWTGAEDESCRECVFEKVPTE